MTGNTAALPPGSCMIFGPSIGHMEGFLKKNYNATDEELTYLKELLDLRFKKCQSSPVGRGNYGVPSIVLDDFLYHGDLGHASNMGLLNELGIHSIIDVCDCPLDTPIVEKFNVLWINLDDVLGADIRKHFEETNKFLQECKEKKQKVLVHCQMGISRSSSIVLAYLMKDHHDTLFKAYDYLTNRRRIAAPNLSFFLQLIRYEKELRAAKEIDGTKKNHDQMNPIVTLDPQQDPAVTQTEARSE